MKEFETLKAEIVTGAKERAPDCSEVDKAAASKDHRELLEIIKRNIGWCIDNQFPTYQQALADFGKELMIELDLYSIGQENTGWLNSGNRNSGNWNSGDRNSGNWNSGNWNSGNRNSGNWNSGDRNSGDRNSGDRNSGNWNSGDRNSGNWNSGDRNSGNWNSGNRNSGDSNSGYRNSGAFCTTPNPVLIIFNKPSPSGMTVKEWENHPAMRILANYLDPTVWVPGEAMSAEEKARHPKWETLDGYLKSIPIKEAWANMWGNLTDDKKAVFTNLENFDAAIFEDITGIKTNHNA